MTQFPLISCPDYLTDRREFLELAATQRAPPSRGSPPSPLYPAGYCDVRRNRARCAAFRAAPAVVAATFSGTAFRSL